MDYRFALIGENIGYSLSPKIFEAIFCQLGIEGEFEVCSVGSDGLRLELSRLVDSGTSGIAVTIPHKNHIRTCLDEESDSVRSVGAVNSIAVTDGRTVGHNTDCYGFSYGLHRNGVTRIEGPVLVLGSGGAARAAMRALHSDFGADRFTISARTPERIDDLKQHFSKSNVNIVRHSIKVGATDETKWSLVVNCTPLGGANAPHESPLPDGFGWDAVDLYYDLNYNADNGTLAEARASGVHSIDGSAMLVAQAVESFRLWTGREIDFEPVFEVVFNDQ
jgi:shikimate dehydrogenase